MALSIWLSLLMISLLGAMSPGPSLAMVAKHSLTGGRWHGIATAWAHACGVGLYALLVILGLATLLHQSPTLFKLISYAGAAYLAYLGMNALRSKGGIADKLATGQAASLAEAARDGIMISLLNPKLGLYFIALFSQFVAAGSDLSSRAMVVATPFMVDGLWYTLVACLLSQAGVLQRLRQQAQWIDRLSGVVLILLACRVIWSS
ncbi:threonine/homoserine/homoserine lactone efflux protein [Sinobacterium caligoides]|uniref:Threonine/homoserine/homoserine lactone efflux protein n=1 Tax=Sinobacterium caligoides TaxID=933926 RepID=A0A3N2DRX4_9GAMM|nr:LysE family translocator [Sinobacterium caligoides]ROS02055.1 threonine/homoserine/homoserine lactone efflux protein [Sinobacterium caligoides]